MADPTCKTCGKAITRADTPDAVKIEAYWPDAGEPGDDVVSFCSMAHAVLPLPPEQP